MTNNNAEGVLKPIRGGAGVLRDPRNSFRPQRTDVLVPPRLMREFHLTEGVRVAGPTRRNRNGMELTAVETICGLPPDRFLRRKPYAQLSALDPTDRFHLSITGTPSMRIVDLIAPIGKGTRGLIVSPPKAGKTMMLEQICLGIRASDPDTRVIVLLIDERPEEVTHFQRAVEAEVLSTSLESSVEDHMELAGLTIAHVQAELECGHDVVLLVDSLTRMGRASNLTDRGRGRILSGGLDSRAMEMPRRFFGLARNIEDGGSVTIIATALIDTGSRMDQLIFEEFKGTGNSEIVLDRSLAEARVFPAIDVRKSGTRKEEKLYGPEDALRLSKLRRLLADHEPKSAIEFLLKVLQEYPTNEQLLAGLTPKGDG